MAWRALVHKEHWIFLAYRVRFLRITEELLRVIKLRFEVCFQLFSHFITASLNSGANGGQNVARSGAKFMTHQAQAFFCDALYGASPASVESANSFVFRINQQHRETICRLYAQCHAGNISYQPIARKGLSVGVVTR